MSENIEELLGKATRVELLNCIQLLAVSVIEHREKRGFVSFRNSMEQLRPDRSGEAHLSTQKKKVLEEVLEMARIISAELAAASGPEASDDDTSLEKRTQPRVNITTPIKVMWEGDSTLVDARLENISWGGASIHVEHLKIDNGDTFQIILPSTSGGSISIEAKLLRTWELPGGKGHGVASRFSSLSTRDEAELEKILEHLVRSGDSGGRRQHTRLTPQLNIQFDGVNEFEATLHDISAGGLGITVPDPLQVGQSLQAVISTLDESYSFKLRARVIRQDSRKFGNVEVYHAGLKFEHPSDELHQLTGELIRTMATLKDENSD